MSDDISEVDHLEPQLSSEEKPAQAKKPLSKNEVMIENLKRVFGSGAGRIFLVVAIIVIFVFISIAVRGLSGKKEIANSKNTGVDQPSTPVVSASNAPITSSEAQRQIDYDKEQAEKAAANGSTFQPPFQTNIVQDNHSNLQDQKSGQTSFFNDQLVKQLKLSDTEDSNSNAKDNKNTDPSKSNDNEAAKNQYQLSQEERERLQKRYDAEVKSRDLYVESLRKLSLKNMETFLGDGNTDALNSYGQYTTVSYAAPGIKTNRDKNLSAFDERGETNPDKNLKPSSTKKVLIKTGNTMYAALTSPVNTDDGLDVTATIYGGKWNKSVLIGKVVRTADNINLMFTTLAPQDERPTMKINAIAIRESDASRGMATDIDRHILTKWGSLFVASVMSGYAKPFQNIGQTTYSNNTTTQTKNEPSNKEIFASTIGDIGQNASSEIKKGFDREDTYLTPNNTGFALFFLDDVSETN